MRTRYAPAAGAFALILTGLILSSWLNGGQTNRSETLTPLTQVPVAVNGGEIGDKLRKWYDQGTAAGNAGDHYDNRDGGHSLLDLAAYPQVQKVEYTEEQIKTRQNWGMQKKVLPYVVFGNSSTSAQPRQGGSIPRTYYTSPSGPAFLFAQYVRNNLYVYPEHLDHDPGRNGLGGYGDLFPTNTPCLIISQGSSGSDQAFMRMMPYVLASFRPEVKKRLVETGLLMPVVQMILRSTNKSLENGRDYLTGKAHPSVFAGRDVDALAMIEMAHKITLSTIPPIALIKAVEETTPINGVDYFEPEITEKLADTPVAIARIFRGSGFSRKIIVSAEESRDVNHRPLKYYWVVLRGDPDRITIKYRNQSQSAAEITVPYRETAPVAADSQLESNRIDIGVFVHNGVYYSPPAFITFYTLDSEARTYSSDHRPIEIGYGIGTSAVSISDWQIFFDLLDSRAETWPAAFLRKQFDARQMDALIKLAGEFRPVHAARTAALQLQAKAKETQKSTGSPPEARSRNSEELATAQRKANEARKSEQLMLDRSIDSLKMSASQLVQRALDNLLHDCSLWDLNSKSIESLYASAGKNNVEAFTRIQQELILLNVAQNPDGVSFRLTPLIKGSAPLAERLTRYEKGMIEQLNAALLGRILFPGMVNSEWRENFVDQRITSAKLWRDVYRYAPDKTPIGWVRYQREGKTEYNADGRLILETDSQGRCIRARGVRYEIEPLKKDGGGRSAESSLRKLKVIPTDAVVEYEYRGSGDWKGAVITR